MSSPPNQGVKATYMPDQSRSLSMAVIEAIEEYLGSDPLQPDFQLYDAINPDALDNLFQPAATPETKIVFSVEDAWVTLWGDGGADVKVHVGETPLQE